MISQQELREWHIVIGWAMRALPNDDDANRQNLRQIQEKIETIVAGSPTTKGDTR